MSEAENIEQFPESKENVYQKISRVTARLCERGVAKEGTNDYDKYKFRGIDQVYDALAPILSDVGLVVLPVVKSRDSQIRQGAKGTSLSYVVLEIDYTLVSADDGSEVVVTFIGEAMDRSDKATNKALSAAYKYMCFQVFCIPLEGQEPDKESPELGKNNSTGRAPESVAKTAAKDGGAPMTDELQEAVTGIHMADFNDDAPGFYEIWDELDNDEKTTVFGNLEGETRKQVRAWQKGRKSEA